MKVKEMEEKEESCKNAAVDEVCVGDSWARSKN
jgi:hypothetical protein